MRTPSVILSEADARAWVRGAREELRGHPTTIKGPTGDPCGVAIYADHARLINPVGDDGAGHLLPLEAELAPGAVVPLAEIRLSYLDEDAKP
jgi:hypothetical protein